MTHFFLLSKLLVLGEQRISFLLLFSLWCTNENIPMLDENPTTIPPWVIRPSDRESAVHCFCAVCFSLANSAGSLCLGAFHLARFEAQEQTDLFGRFVFVGLGLAVCGNVDVLHFGNL